MFYIGDRVPKKKVDIVAQQLGAEMGVSRWAVCTSNGKRGEVPNMGMGPDTCDIRKVQATFCYCINSNIRQCIRW
jgi:hypothetical protein